MYCEMLLDTAVAVADRVTSWVMLNIKCPHNPLVLKALHLLEINESIEAKLLSVMRSGATSRVSDLRFIIIIIIIIIS